MILATLGLALVLAAAPAPAASSRFEPLVMSWQAKPQRCALTVSFGSVGTGIDMVTRGRIERLLERDPAVVSVRPYLRGREGETLLCIRVASDSAIPPLFRRLRALVPPRTYGHPISIEAKGGLRFGRY